jgi:HEPN domain-containing protein
VNPATLNWLEKARDDMLLLKALPLEAYLTGGMAFHAEQCIEKCLKAVLCERKQLIPRSHDLVYLYSLVSKIEKKIPIENTLLMELSALYIDSRYPGAFGLLPSGRPSLADAGRFIAAAEIVMQQTEMAIMSTNS